MQAIGQMERDDDLGYITAMQVGHRLVKPRLHTTLSYNKRLDPFIF